MIRRAAQYVPLKIDVDKHPKLAQKYNIRGIPAILLVEADGDVQERVVGFKSPREFAELLDTVATRRVLKAQSEVRERPEDSERQARLGLVLGIRGKLQEAESALGKAESAGYRGPIAGRAYNTLGDRHHARKAVDQAIDAYRRADRVGMDAIVRAYAKSRLLDHYLAEGDTRQAQQVAEALIRLEGAPPEYVEKAKNSLKG